MIKLFKILEAINTGETVYINKNGDITSLKINRNRVKSKGHTVTIIHGTVTDYSLIRSGISLQDDVTMYYCNNEDHFITIGGKDDTSIT